MESGKLLEGCQAWPQFTQQHLPNCGLSCGSNTGTPSSVLVPASQWQQGDMTCAFSPLRLQIASCLKMSPLHSFLDIRVPRTISRSLPGYEEYLLRLFLQAGLGIHVCIMSLHAVPVRSAVRQDGTHVLSAL